MRSLRSQFRAADSTLEMAAEEPQSPLMTLDQAKEIIAGSKKSVLKDRAFGDREVTWTKDGKIVADGYFGYSGQSVYINGQKFQGQDAYALDNIRVPTSGSLNS